ncbi:MAG: hypothetical protein IPK16_26090 [Anaerolineales bacterium]|nr:hypothetical protein [Anaerolineales bacterium]
MNDLELLRQYEPVVCYTGGEHFFPCAVDGYVQQCSLWSLNKKKQRQQLIPTGELDLDRLATFDDVPPGETLHLRIVDKPLDAAAYQRWRQLPDRPALHAPGRFYTRWPGVAIGKFTVQCFSPRAWHRTRRYSRRADLKYREIRTADPRYVYYARVLRQGGYDSPLPFLFRNERLALQLLWHQRS